jgi:hypothetical protein
MAQVVRRRPLTVEAPFRVPGQSIGICDGQSDTDKGFLFELFGFTLSVLFHCGSPEPTEISSERWTIGRRRPQFRDVISPHRREKHVCISSNVEGVFQLLNTPLSEKYIRLKRAKWFTFCILRTPFLQKICILSYLLVWNHPVCCLVFYSAVTIYLCSFRQKWRTLCKVCFIPDFVFQEC